VGARVEFIAPQPIETHAKFDILYSLIGIVDDTPDKHPVVQPDILDAQGLSYLILGNYHTRVRERHNAGQRCPN